MQQDFHPRDWREHRFGLAPDRWARLDGRAVWITGAGTGYGRAISTALACGGARVFLTGRRREKLQETCAGIASLGVPPDRCVPVPADVRNGNAVADACRRIERDCPALDGLVVSAALPQRRTTPWPLQTEPAAYWHELFDVNVFAPWLATVSMLPHMLRAAAPRVVFLTSEAGWASTSGFGHYNVSKAALNSLGASLAEECAARHPGADIQINVLDPGEARTEMNQSSSRSPFAAVPMTLLLLSHPPGGPNGRFFHADGRHLAFGHAAPYPCSLTTGEIMDRGGAAAAPQRAPRLIGARDGYNIVEYGGWFYGIPQALGELHLDRDDVAARSGVIRERSRDAVELQIRRGRPG